MPPHPISRKKGVNGIRKKTKGSVMGRKKSNVASEPRRQPLLLYLSCDTWSHMRKKEGTWVLHLVYVCVLGVLGV